MSNITIHYQLSETGRKHILKDNLDYPATREQIIEIDSDHPRFEAFLEHAVVDDEGNAYVKYFKDANEKVPQFDEPQSADSLLNWIEEQERARKILAEEQPVRKAENLAQKRENVLVTLKKTVELTEKTVLRYEAEQFDGHEAEHLEAIADRLRDQMKRAKNVDDEMELGEIRKLNDDLRSTGPRLEGAARSHHKWIHAKQKQREAESWIQEFGSDRLRRIVEEGFLKDSMAVYRDERLSVERPHWKWADDVRGETLEPRNVPEEAFDLLDKAREVDPDAKLSYLKIKHVCDDDCSFGCPVSMGEAPRTVWKGYIAVAAFLDREIAFGGPLGD